MLRRSASTVAFLCALTCSSAISPGQQPVQAPTPQAPPAPPAIVSRNLSLRSGISTMGGPTFYSIGSPTDEEQYYVELINRARANPPAEGTRLATTADPDVLSAIASFGVDLAMMQTEFNAIAAAPPVSISAALTNSARGHSDWMFANAVQNHTGSGGSDPGARMTAAGYAWTTYGESIFSYAKSVFYGHAGFQIDWGGSAATGGMQSPRGHRNNTHNSSFREIGVGVKLGSNTLNSNTVGPQLVTQDFATANSTAPFVTGVVYYDLNANNFYDPGEGIGGITVGVEGSSYSAVTANSGGYSVPVPGVDAVRPVTFSGLGLGQSANATISGLKNVKTDFVPAYAPPVVTGPATIYTGSPANFTISSVGGATQYGWQYAERISAAAENCDALTNVSTSTTAGYNVVDTSAKDSGSASFHLAHPAFVSQMITLQKTYFPQASSTLQFRSRLGYATTVETARVQVSINGSSNWVDVYAQNGTNSPGELGFTTRSVPLSGFAGQFIKIRFAYTVTNSAYTGTSPEVGWHIDTITFPNTSELVSPTTVEPVASPAFSFSPPKTGTFLLSARPYISGRYWSFGPIKEISAQAPIGYAEWVATLNPAVTEGPTGDHDHDGLSNLIEYAFGSNPNTPTASSTLPQPLIQGTQWQVSYTAPASITGITYGAEWSTDLVSWTPLTDSGSGSFHAFAVSMTGQNKIFFRHKITPLP